MIMDVVTEVIDAFAAQPVGYWWVLGALILILLVRRWIGSGRLLALKNATGRVMVSRGAIKGLIMRTCQSVDGISHPQARIYTRGGKLRLRVYVHLRGTMHLGEATTLLQEKLDINLRQNLGLERIGRIDVVVNDIHPAVKKKSSKSEESTISNPDQPKAAYPWGASAEEGIGQD